jgi:hypothetical protein
VRLLTPEELDAFSAEYDLPPAIAERDYVACRVAHAITEDAEMHDAVAFKGGFILRNGYGSERTSKDIDTTIGRRMESLDPERLRRIIRGRCSDLAIRFPRTKPVRGVDSLDLGAFYYAGPFGGGKLVLEMSRREDWIEPLVDLTIDRFGIPAFQIACLAPEELIAEKWRCLIQRAPRRFGDPYDLWFLWTVVNERGLGPTWSGIRPDLVRELVPQKVKGGTTSSMLQALESYRTGWARAKGNVIPETAPDFGTVARAVQEAAAKWTPWR